MTKSAGQFAKDKYKPEKGITESMGDLGDKYDKIFKKKTSVIYKIKTGKFCGRVK